ncbi:FtsQ-type POTRA domain-containing protein, partial [Candidatus Pelagibacter sp.]|nr:FtsQ-type POTRA domain-containing protein [Candidatus Pelagibacter sp.]
MHQNKSKKILVYFFLLLVVGSINNKTFSKVKFFQIKNINITGLADVENETLLSNLNNIFFKNILLINKNEISKVIEKNTLVEKYTILKKYPSTLNVRIEKTKFLAKINKNNKIFYIGSNGKLIKNNIKYELPFIFGNPGIN